MRVSGALRAPDSRGFRSPTPSHRIVAWAKAPPATGMGARAFLGTTLRKRASAIAVDDDPVSAELGGARLEEGDDSIAAGQDAAQFAIVEEGTNRDLELLEGQRLQGLVGAPPDHSHRFGIEIRKAGIQPVFVEADLIPGLERPRV